MNIMYKSQNRGDFTIDASEHAFFRSLLPGYAATIALGETDQLRFLQVKQHLEGCQPCQAELNQMLHCLTPLYDGLLEMVKPTGSYDLAFLTAQSQCATQEPQAIVHLFSPQSGIFTGLILNLEQQLAELHRICTNTFRVPSLLQARGSILVSYEPDVGSTAGASISIQFIRNNTNPQHCDLTFAMLLPEELAAPNGITATLQVDDMTWKQTGDDWETFIFPAVLRPDSHSLHITAEIV